MTSKRKMTTSNRKPTSADLRRWADEAASHWLQEDLTEERVRGYVHNLLNSRLEAVVSAMLGIEDRWGRVELNPHGPLDAAVREAATEAAAEWVANHLADLPAPDAKAMSAMRTVYREAFISAARDAAQTAGEEAGRNYGIKEMCDYIGDWG